MALEMIMDLPGAIALIYVALVTSVQSSLLVHDAVACTTPDGKQWCIVSGNWFIKETIYDMNMHDLSVAYDVSF